MSAVATVVLIFGVIVTLLGLLGIVLPKVLLGFVSFAWKFPAGYYAVVGARVVFGLFLLAAAEKSRFPSVMTVLGAIALVAAVILSMLGFERTHRLVNWWLERSPAFIRGWSIVAIAFGVFLAMAVVK